MKKIIEKIKKIPLFPFYLKKSYFTDFYAAYLPDSYKDINNKSTFLKLYKMFTNKNRFNNTGDIPRLLLLMQNIQNLIDEGIYGDFAELGVWRGNTAAILAYYARELNKTVFLFDTFNGFDENDLKGIDSNKEKEFTNTSVQVVKNTIGKNCDNCKFIIGHFPDSLKNINIDNNKFMVVSLDCDLYEPMKAGLEYFYPKMLSGGILFIHDYSSLLWSGTKLAVDEFRDKYNLKIILMPDKSGTIIIRKI